jgi:hypothetical protein
MLAYGRYTAAGLAWQIAADKKETKPGYVGRTSTTSGT